MAPQVEVVVQRSALVWVLIFCATARTCSPQLSLGSIHTPRMRTEAEGALVTCSPQLSLGSIHTPRMRTEAEGALVTSSICSCARMLNLVCFRARWISSYFSGAKDAP